MAQCRFCSTSLEHTFVNLGGSPLANSYVKTENLPKGEVYYPLLVQVCHTCFLVQLEELESAENIFSDYLYFSSYSDAWLAHAKKYVEDISARLNLGTSSQVIEIASNDGYLLQYFLARGVQVLGVEPAQNVAAVAQKKGIPSVTEFFGKKCAEGLKAKGHQADLMLGNNVLAHVPDINDFISGIPLLLKPEGVVTFEFPHLLKLINYNQFDTIYHEHFSYLSLLFVGELFKRHGLRVWDVEELPTHGGSLRVYGCHQAAKHKEGKGVAKVLSDEKAAHLDTVAGYSGYADRVIECKARFLEFLFDARRKGKTIAAYGAAAKGNTFLNYCGAASDIITQVADRSPHKQGLLLPGTHVPICSPEQLLAAKPDYVIILPWNLKEEISKQLAAIREWGGQFVVAIPELQVF